MPRIFLAAAPYATCNCITLQSRPEVVEAYARFPVSAEIQPRIPPELERLQEMANDLMYSWDRSIRSLFHCPDRAVWESCDHNPKAFFAGGCRNTG